MEQVNIAWLNNLRNVAKIIDKLGLSLERTEFGAKRHSGVLERGRIGISKNTHINVPTTLPSFCWTKQNFMAERTLFGSTTY